MGLIGGSIARRLHERGARIIGIDPDAQAIAYAREYGLIDEALWRPAAMLAEVEIFVVAAPLAATLKVLEEYATGGVCGPDALVIDVASVKVPLLPFVRRVPGFVPTHPLAGAETSGASSSRADLFVDRPWVFVPTGDGARDGRAAAFIAEMGAHPVPLDAERHDRIVAFTSHLPQLLSTILASLLASEADPEMAALHGPGLESMLRLARSGWPMWSSILSANTGPIAASLRALAAALSAAARGLEAGDATPLEAAFEQANAFAAQLDALDDGGR